MSDERIGFVINSMIRRLLNRKTMLYTILTVSLIAIVMAFIAYRSYENDKAAIINQQMQQLLTISKSICSSLEEFVNEKVEGLEILTLNSRFAYGIKSKDNSSVRAALEAYEEAQQVDIQMVYEVNSAGQIIYQYPEKAVDTNTESYSILKADIEHVVKSKLFFIGRAHKNENGKFVINLLAPVFYDEEFEGVIVASVSLESMYEKLVKDAKAGKKGYAMVKDEDGIILMHPAKEQVGIDVIKTRKEMYPDFDFKELETLIKQQQTDEEGTAIYYSYWWPDDVLERTKKLNAFSRAHIGDYFWIVAMTMSYDEVEGPLGQSLAKIVEVSAAIILIAAFSIFVILKIKKNKEALEVETRYLKELNLASDELRKKDIQLQHSQKLQMVGTLTGGIAHEFNNLLTPILGYAEILKNKLDRNSEGYDYASEIYEASQKSKDIIEQILVFSRLDNGISKYKPVQVSEIVKETCNLVRSTITPNVSVVYEEKSDCGCIMANKVQIHQVVFNLCTNAFHAMKYTGGTITVSLDTIRTVDIQNMHKEASFPEAYVCITVSDTGCGMSKETLEKVFDPFFTTKPTGEGTGLGLFIAQGIVENHKGLITVESEVGKGSTFRVYFPQIRSRQERQEQEEAAGYNGTKSILLVDDEPKVLKVMKKGLEQYGFKVVAELNSIEALKIFSHNPAGFDVVVTDQTMPYIKGTELAERLKVINPMIKIILVTGFVDEKVQEYIDKTIIDEYITKPVTGEQIAKVIETVLRNG